MATLAPPHADPHPSWLRFALSAAAVVAVTVLALGWDGPPLMARIGDCGSVEGRIGFSRKENRTHDHPE